MTFMERWAENLPAKPYYSTGTKDVGGVWLRIAGREFAKSAPLIQFNEPWTLRYLVVDHDGDAISAADDALLPAPTAVIMNPRNGHGHIVYELAAPVYTGKNARSKPREWAESIRARLTTALDGDPGFAGLVAKNPLHPEWRTIETGPTYSLAEIEEALRFIERSPLPSPVRVRVDEEKAALGRNCNLFEIGREYAAHIWPSCDSSASLRSAILDYLDRQNRELFGTPLPPSELRSIAKSISRGAERGKLARIARPEEGAMKLPTMKGRYWAPVEFAEEVRERRQASAIRSNAIRSARARSAFWRAVLAVEQGGEALTADRIMGEGGPSRATIYRLLAALKNMRQAAAFFSGETVSHGLSDLSLPSPLSLAEAERLVEEWESTLRDWAGSWKWGWPPPDRLVDNPSPLPSLPQYVCTDSG